jgi:RNA polymerase sigma-70 factor (ECF subfamily)
MVELHSSDIYGLALRMMQDPQEAEDVLQETFLNAFRAIESFEGRSSLGTWLYRIAANQALMKLRKSKPVTQSIDEPILGPDGDTLPKQFTDWCCLPEKEFMTSETVAQLKEALSGLTPNLKSVFVLRDLQGLSTLETAEILDISQSAVKTRLLRARLKLRESLSSYFSGRVEVGRYD